MNKDIGCYDMKYEEHKEMYRNAWSERFNCIIIDRAKIKKRVKIVFSTEAKTHILNAIPKVKLFSFPKLISK